MIVKILSRGKSFKGLSTYLTHDPKAETDKRVGWTHTLNLANDHVPSAVDEMLWTARNAELLKQEAGIRAGGRATENAVKHLSLNWPPDERPDRAHMIEATEDFLRHMKWQDHQAVLVAHTDRDHQHCHILLNVVHPETGLRLDDNFERRRAQAWALDYERDQGKIHCEQRLKNADEREDAPTRPGWLAFEEKQKEFERDEKSRRDQAPILFNEAESPKNPNDEEWKILKAHQRLERQEFFSEGKSAFNDLRRSIYREVREDFRERWADHYAAKKDGLDAGLLATAKAELVAEQKAALDGRRDAACDELKTARDGAYRDLLDSQRDERLGLSWRQEAGLDNAHFLELAQEKDTSKDMVASFRETAEVTTARDTQATEAVPAKPPEWSRPDNPGLKSGANIADSLGTGLGVGLISMLDSIADGFTGSTPAPRPRAPEPDPLVPNPFEAVIDETRKRVQRAEEEAERDRFHRQWSRGD